MAHAGSRLKPTDCLERHRLESQPSSRTGENPPYGMIGRIEETSASFEARSAPLSYPTTFGSPNLVLTMERRHRRNSSRRVALPTRGSSKFRTYLKIARRSRSAINVG